MSNHTINSWKKYCLYRKNAIEDLRKRAVSNAEKKAISNDLSGTARETLPILHPETVDPQPANPQQIDPRLLDPQPANPQQIDPQLLVPQQTIPQLTIPPQSIPQPIIPQQTTPQLAVPQPTIFQKTVPRSTILQRATPQPVIPQQATPQSTLPQHMTPQPTAPQQTTPQQVDPQPSTTLREGRPLPYEKVAEPEPVRVKTEPLDGDQLDFAFATELLSGWRPNEESDAELWKRMETIVCSLAFPRVSRQLMGVLSGPVLLRHRGRHFVRGIGPGLNTSLQSNLPGREDDPVSHGALGLLFTCLSASCFQLILCRCWPVFVIIYE